MSDESVEKIVDDIIKRLHAVQSVTPQILHCDSCHHEWDSVLGTVCDWCGGRGK